MYMMCVNNAAIMEQKLLRICKCPEASLPSLLSMDDNPIYVFPKGFLLFVPQLRGVSNGKGRKWQT